jgi:hypothetical protein
MFITDKIIEIFIFVTVVVVFVIGVIAGALIF